MGRTRRGLAEWTCQGCGFTIHSHLRNRLYCSDDCSLLYRIAKSNSDCICGEKETDVISFWPTPELRAEAERAGRAFAEAHKHCRKAMIDSIGRLTACWCASCIRSRGEDRQRATSGSRKATRVPTPEFRKNRKQVLERGGWTCEICELPIYHEASPFDDRAPAVDHIIPVRHGGTDDLDNLRAAHRWCNLRRESGFGYDQQIFADARIRFLNVEENQLDQLEIPQHPNQTRGSR